MVGELRAKVRCVVRTGSCSNGVRGAHNKIPSAYCPPQRDQKQENLGHDGTCGRSFNCSQEAGSRVKCDVVEISHDVPAV